MPLQRYEITLNSLDRVLKTQSVVQRIAARAKVFRNSSLEDTNISSTETKSLNELEGLSEF